MPSTTPLVDVISCLDSYNNSHIKASSSLKSTIWNISIARRQKGRLGVGYTYSASDVREELRAHVRLDGGGGHEPLEAQEEPPLDHDEDDGIDATKTSADSGEGSEEQGVGGGDGAFVIRFGPSTTGRTCGGIGGDTNDTMLGSSDGLGLRQRKGKESKTVVEKGWTESCYEDELEEKLRNVDPLELFGGLPPKELKIAQKKAKESLEHYVTAANKVREILSIMKTK